MSSEGTEIRGMNPAGVAQAIEWAWQEGWNPGLMDTPAFFEADPDGYFQLRRDGEKLAIISAVRASEDVAFVGLYIVDPKYRGQGYGKLLWDEVLGRYAGVTLGLDAVPEQEATYASDGFVTAYGNARFFGDDLPLPDEDLVRSLNMVHATELDFDDLVAFDGAHYFGPRPGFLRQWIKENGHEALATTDDAGRITGFAVRRRSVVGHRIGPVFTGEMDIARALILTLARSVDERIFIDVPLPNVAAVEMLESFGMESSFETRRMYNGPAPELPLARIFGITTLELG